MNENFRRQIELHSAGATVEHAGEYSSLAVPSSMDTPDNAFIRKWIAPFYMDDVRDAQDFMTKYATVRHEITIELCSSLLIWFNWRSRIVAAYFAAIERYLPLEDHIGRLFLRSDVCYAGHGYALALAAFNTPNSAIYLEKYLDHYLTRKDLWFDQASAMSALSHIDLQNGSNILPGYLQKWKVFAEDKPNHDLERSIRQFQTQMENLEHIRKSLA